MCDRHDASTLDSDFLFHKAMPYEALSFQRLSENKLKYRFSTGTNQGWRS
jgi:hypothetical protein